MKRYLILLNVLISCSENPITNNDTSKMALESNSQIQQSIDTTKKTTLDTNHHQARFILQEVDKNAIIIAWGTEPGWTLTLLKDKLLFVGNYGQDTIQEAYNKSIDFQQFPLEYKSKNITFKLEKKKCIAISGEELDISVKVFYKDQEFQGCGRMMK